MLRLFVLFTLVLLSVAGYFGMRGLFPQWFYTDMETFYLRGLEQAIEEGKTEVQLAELMPFAWSKVCYVSTPYYAPSSTEISEVKTITGVDIADWFDEGRDATLIFVGAGTVLRVRDFSGIFQKTIRTQKTPIYISTYVSSGHSPTLKNRLTGNGGNILCGDRNDVYVNIKTL